MTSPVRIDPLAYYSAHRCALFPIKAGSKDPFGIVGSFKNDHSTDPKQWSQWQAANPGCNFGVVAFASRLVIVDIDTKELGRDGAWTLWCELCAAWQIPVLTPHVQSARGGWHVYFAVPDHIDPATLRQPDAIKKHINVRCIGYTVAAGSYFTDEQGQSLPYSLLSAEPPYPAPAALLEHCTRRPAQRTTAPPGSRDKNDGAALFQWLAERDAFASYEDWCAAGMAAKLEWGDEGFSVWELTFDDTVTTDQAAAKWESFSAEPDSHSVTLNTFLQRAHKLGWRGQVRKSSAAMFDSVAALAAAAGASLSSAPPNALPMMAGQEELTRLATPVLEDFLAATSDAPSSPAGLDLPMLPDAMSGHGLYPLMTDCLTRIFALSEIKPFRAARVVDPLAVLSVMHADIFESVCRRLRLSGAALHDRKIKWAAANLSEKVERVTVTLEKWEYDAKGEIQSDNSDNVVVLLGVLSLEIRWNAWLERMEIQGGAADTDLRWPTWTYVDDSIVAKLRTRANRTKTRFRPGKDFIWESLLSIAHMNTVDPVLDHLAALESGWDRTPRLITWLSRYCGSLCDPYHQAVGRMIVGGMVHRARHPGCKFDFMPVFYGSQGSGKSTMAAILADMGQSSLPAIMLGNGQNFTDNVLLGDAAKELILALAGKLVVEIGEMGMRNNTNAAHIKAMISRQVDSGRTAYARAVAERPRRNIFFGTTNDKQPLTDPSGNRRFLPVNVSVPIDLAAFAAEVPQLIGEAAHLESRGETFWLPQDVWTDAASYQDAARQASDIEVYFDDWFSGDVEAFVTVADIVRLCDATGRKNIGQVAHFMMERLGFKESALYLDGRKARAWYRSAKEMLPKHIASLPRYSVDLTNGAAPRVVLRQISGTPAASVVIPPIPSRS